MKTTYTTVDTYYYYSDKPYKIYMTYSCLKIINISKVTNTTYREIEIEIEMNGVLGNNSA